MFHVSLFAMMAHLSDISAGVVGQIRGCTFLLYKTGEHFALLRRGGDEVSRDEAFARVLRIPRERSARTSRSDGKAACLCWDSMELSQEGQPWKNSSLAAWDREWWGTERAREARSGT